VLKSIARSFGIIVLFTASVAVAETVTVRSGSGNIGSRDSSVTFLLGPANTDFSHPFTSTDFSNAQSGPAGFIVSRNPLWVSGLSEDASAKWIGTNTSAGLSQGNTALYAVSFTIPSAFSSATLTLHWAADDGLGTINQGLYVNGTTICGNLIDTQNQFAQQHNLACDVGSLLHVGTNWLYFNAVNALGAAGLLFSATITTTDITAPPTVSASPSSLSFDVIQGSNPMSQTVQVLGSAAGLNFSAQASSTGWLSISPTSGTTPAKISVSVNATNLSPGTYNGTILVAGIAGATGQTTINVILTVPPPTIRSVVNAATYVSGSVVSPGEIVTIFGTNIGPATAAGLTLDPTTRGVATSIGGVQVLFNGTPAPMIYASSTQVSAVVPYEMVGIATPAVWIKYLGQTSNAFQLTSVTTAPGLFTQNSSGSGPGAILNQDNSLNGPGNPAAKGGIVQVYLTGEGQTSPGGTTGKLTTVSPTPPLTPYPLLPIGVTINGQPALYTYAGEAPGLVAGVMQLNVQIPSNALSGNLPITVSIGGNISQSNVTVSVR
jgi:uncharacterized protein (TIGR03437 family)